ncbi:SubName: Full=Uncharacterized protein {ECO:0000313/EMBL:CCA74567.1} [Serendipita indica DSM 11827]|nr:SubName: Full=Uncharacterized protein {ECO:0000313/EMBL:CCA74567.1} [Serendipita indica DSM 11827]
MILLLASRLLLFSLVLSIASVGAHPSPGEGTLPLLHGVGITKHPARKGVPATLQPRARTAAVQKLILFVAPVLLLSAVAQANFASACTRAARIRRRLVAKAAVTLDKPVAMACAAMLVTHARYLGNTPTTPTPTPTPVLNPDPIIDPPHPVSPGHGSTPVRPAPTSSSTGTDPRPPKWKIGAIAGGSSLSTVLVLAVASIAAHPSADGRYPIPDTLREAPPALMAESLPEGTSPLVYGLGISKTLARMVASGTLQARAVAPIRPLSAAVRARSVSGCALAAQPRKRLAAKDAVILEELVAMVLAAILVIHAQHLEHALLLSGGGASSSTGVTTSTRPVSSATSTQGGGGGGGIGGGNSSSSSRSSTGTGTVAGSTNSSTPEPESKNNTGAIVGGVVGGVAAVIILVGVLLFLLHKQKKKKQGNGASEVASNYTQQPMMGQHSPYSPGFAGAGAAGVGAGAMAAGAPGTPGPQGSYYGAGGPNSGAPTPALVYNQGEQYPNNSFQQNYAQQNNAYGGGVDQYGRPLSAASGGAPAAPLPMWVQRPSNATPASTAPSGFPDHQGYAPPPGAPQQPYYGGGAPHGNY